MSNTTFDKNSIRVQSYQYFLTDLELYQNCSEQDEEENFGSDAYERYREFMAGKFDFLKAHSTAVFESQEHMYRRNVQEQYFKNHALSLDRLSQLLLEDDFREIVTTWMREFYQHPFVSIDIGSRPLKEGDSDIFNARLKAALLDATEKQRLLFPPLLPVGVTIFHIPPNGKHRPVDLDNLARKILPHIHKILKPPRTYAHARPGELSFAAKAMSREPSKIHKSHVAFYTALTIPRLRNPGVNAARTFVGLVSQAR
jgi:hypothetical protein